MFFYNISEENIVHLKKIYYLCTQNPNIYYHADWKKRGINAFTIPTNI